MFAKTAEFYDAVYSFKNYALEAGQIRDLIRTHVPAAKTVLDVACGTAEHALQLKNDFLIDGIDLQPEFVEAARNKLNEGNFVVADMRSFDMGKRYDVVQCLFSSIGYLLTPDDVISALTCFAEHTNPGGVIIVEPWITPESFQAGEPNLTTVDQPGLKIARVNVSEVEGKISHIKFQYLIAARGRPVEHVQENHALALYSVDEMVSFFERAGLKVEHDPVGIFGRGLYIART